MHEPLIPGPGAPEAQTAAEGAGVEAGRVSRRSFLKGAGALVAATGASALAGCQPPDIERPPRGAAARDLPASVPNIRPADGTFLFFTAGEARAVEAVTARILPGDPADPGAREAGVVYFIDRMLASNEGFPEPTYRLGPFAQPYEGDAPPADGQVPVLWIPEEEFDRYGFQAPFSLRDLYRSGLASLEAFTQARFGASFADLPEAQQDAVVGALADDEADGFEDPGAADFFDLLQGHTVEGMFSDPAYGGNRDMVGWRLIGFPGAQRAYTPRDLLNEEFYRDPQTLARLPVFAPGEPDRRGPVYPVRGTHHEGRRR